MGCDLEQGLDTLKFLVFLVSIKYQGIQNRIRNI